MLQVRSERVFSEDFISPNFEAFTAFIRKQGPRSTFSLGTSKVTAVAVHGARGLEFLLLIKCGQPKAKHF